MFSPTTIRSHRKRPFVVIGRLAFLVGTDKAVAKWQKSSQPFAGAQQSPLADHVSMAVLLILSTLGSLRFENTRPKAYDVVVVVVYHFLLDVVLVVAVSMP